MSHERELRRMILDAPEDIPARLVYADHLIERGDPRGDFIALDCAREREDEASELRRRALWQRHGAEWMTADVGFDQLHWARDIDYRDGFVDHLRIGVPELLEREAQLADQPIRSLELVQLGRGGVDRLASSPVLQRVRRLALVDGLDQVSEPTLARLLESVPRLEELALTASPSQALWGALERCPRLAQITRLELAAVPITPQGGQWLATHLPALEALHSTGLDGLALLAFTKHAARPLRELHVHEYDRQESTDDELAELLARPSLAELTSLSLGGCVIGARTKRVLAELACAPRLRWLALPNHLDPEVVVAATTPPLPQLEGLYVPGNQLTDTVCLRPLGALRHVDLTRSALTSVATILDHAPGLVSLGAAFCPIADDSLAGAAQLRTLDLAGTPITPRALDALVQLIGLRELDLDLAQLGTDGIRRLADAPLDKVEWLSIGGDGGVPPIHAYFARDWRPHWRSPGDTSRLVFERRLA